MRHLPTVVFLVLFFPLSTGLAVTAETMEVPGGRAAVARLLGHVDRSPEGFSASLNRVLLGEIDDDHETGRSAKRIALRWFLETARELRREYPRRIELSGAAALDGLFSELAARVGYRVDATGGGVSLEPRPGDKWLHRRRAARALDWDLLEIARALAHGESRTIAVLSDEAVPPIPFDLWSEMTGRKVDSTDAIDQLLDDQRLGLVVAGLEQVSVETAEYLTANGWLGQLYREASIAFFRYAPSIEIRDGELVIPGSAQARPVWEQLLRVSETDAVSYLGRLLGEAPPRAMHLWHALYFTPPPLAGYYLTPSDEGARARKTFLGALHGQLGEIDDRAALSSARGRGQGVPSLLRSLTLDPEGTALELPGGLGLWVRAIRGEDAPKKAAALDKVAAKAGAKELDDRRFFLQVLKADVKTAPARQSALPRVTRTLNLFGDERGLLTPENVILIARAVETYSMALRTVGRMELADPTTVRDYLRAVAWLDDREYSPEKFLVISSFQGGVELVRMLVGGGRVPADTGEEFLREWSAMHLAQRDSKALAPLQLDWLIRLTAELKEVDDSEPGRGPREKALLAALTAREDPQRFSWRGLELEGRRGRDVASRMAAHVRRQDVPSIDRLWELHAGFRQLRQSCEEQDLAGVRETARALVDALEALPAGPTTAFSESSRFREWLAPVDRPRAINHLLRFEKQEKADKLPKMARSVHQVEGLMARELRAFLVGAVYLECMGPLDSLLFQEVGLVRRHTLIENVESTHAILNDSPWLETEIVAGILSPIGTRLTGHLGGVPEVLALYHAGRADRAGDEHLVDFRRVWLGDWLTTPWSGISREDSRLVAALVEAGGRLLSKARDGGAARGFVAARVPVRRLEEFFDGEDAVVSVSERLSLGLAALAGDAYGPADPQLLDASTRGRLDELGGDKDPASRLWRIGASTPALNGGVRRWIGTWPPYESLENEAGVELIAERTLIDLRLAVAAYLGRHELPGEAGADLMLGILEEMADELRIETRRDWKSIIRWTSGMDDEYFDRRFRQCLQQGLYSLRDS